MTFTLFFSFSVMLFSTTSEFKHPFSTYFEKVVELTVPDEYSSAIVNIMNLRKGMMLEMGPAEGSEGQTRLIYSIPTRGLIGIRSSLLTASRGTAVLDSQFDDYKEHVGLISAREKGSLLAFEGGTANPFGIAGAQVRGSMFIEPKTEVYKDMIIGVHQVSECVF